MTYKNGQWPVIQPITTGQMDPDLWMMTQLHLLKHQSPIGIKRGCGALPHPPVN